MRRLVLVALAITLASCGWSSATRLIPLSERAVPQLSGEYVFAGRTVTYGRKLGGNLMELIVRTSEGDTSRKVVAFDHVRHVHDDYEMRDFYLVETDVSTPENGSNFAYQLIEVTQGLDEDGSRLPDKTIREYRLNCSDASDGFDNNPDERCRFSRYADVMAAVRDVLVWMDDPRIPLMSDQGSQPTGD